MSWNVKISNTAREDLDNLRAYQPELYLRAFRMTQSISVDPRQGIGAPKNIRGLGPNVWIRNLSLKHRVVYELLDNCVAIAAYRTHIE